LGAVQCKLFGKGKIDVHRDLRARIPKEPEDRVVTFGIDLHYNAGILGGWLIEMQQQSHKV